MDYQNIIQISKDLTATYTNEYLAKSNGPSIKPEDVYVVWYCKTLKNVKLLLSTPVDDGMYYEVTYNGDKDELYFDAYMKVENKVMRGVSKHESTKPNFN